MAAGAAAAGDRPLRLRRRLGGGEGTSGAVNGRDATERLGAGAQIEPVAVIE